MEQLFKDNCDMEQYNDAYAYYIYFIFNEKQKLKVTLMTLTVQFLEIKVKDLTKNNQVICWLSIFHDLSKLKVNFIKILILLILYFII